METDKIKGIKEAISIMKKAHDTYCTLAARSLNNDLNEDYWHWRGLAEGTRRSWELLEELFDIQDEDEVNEEEIITDECDGRCLNCDNYDTSACPDKH